MFDKSNQVQGDQENLDRAGLKPGDGTGGISDPAKENARVTASIEQAHCHTIANDIHGLIEKIEHQLGAHVNLTSAQTALQDAEQHIRAYMSDVLHGHMFNKETQD